MREIIAALEAEIEQVPNGARLPSEHELMARFGATRSTVRRALEELEARYLVHRVHGSGTFVHRRVDYLVSSRLAPSLHQTIEQAGATARTVLLDARDEGAPTDVADRLNIESLSECTRLCRVGYIDGQPATTVEEWLPTGILDYAHVSLRAIESLAEVLRGSGYEPVRSWSRISTEFPPADVIERLEMRSPAPVWHVETLTKDGAHGAVLLFSRSWMRQDRVRVVIDFERQAFAV